MRKLRLQKNPSRKLDSSSLRMHLRGFHGNTVSSLTRVGNTDLP